MNPRAALRHDGRAENRQIDAPGVRERRAQIEQRQSCDQSDAGHQCAVRRPLCAPVAKPANRGRSKGHHCGHERGQKAGAFIAGGTENRRAFDKNERDAKCRRTQQPPRRGRDPFLRGQAYEKEHGGDRAKSNVQDMRDIQKFQKILRRI